MKPTPVVRLRAQSDDGSDNETGGGVDGAALEEFQHSRREREELQELKMLEQLKSGIAAKAKQKIRTMEKDPSGRADGSEVSGSDLVMANKRNSLNEFLVANNVTALINQPPTIAAALPQNVAPRKEQALLPNPEPRPHPERNHVSVEESPLKKETPAHRPFARRPLWRRMVRPRVRQCRVLVTRSTCTTTVADLLHSTISRCSPAGSASFTTGR